METFGSEALYYRGHGVTGDMVSQVMRASDFAPLCCWSRAILVSWLRWHPSLTRAFLSGIIYSLKPPYYFL